MVEHDGGASGVNSIAISPDGNILASGNDDKTIKLWDLNTQQLIHTFTGHRQAVRAIAFSPDGILASACDDKTIKLWNLTKLHGIPRLLKAGMDSGVKTRRTFD